MSSEKRLIWDEDAKRHLIALCVGHHTETLHIDMILNAILRHAPTVDAVEVVRCKDCIHYDNSEGIQWCHLNSKFAKWGTDWHGFPEDGYCSYGERK